MPRQPARGGRGGRRFSPVPPPQTRRQSGNGGSRATRRRRGERRRSGPGLSLGPVVSSVVCLDLPGGGDGCAGGGQIEGVFSILAKLFAVAAGCPFTCFPSTPGRRSLWPLPAERGTCRPSLLVPFNTPYGPRCGGRW